MIRTVIACVVGALAIVTVTGPARAQTTPAPGEDLARDMTRTKPVAAGKDARATFRIAPGFRLDPIAVEPIVTDPVAACFDADGRLYVVEMRGYPYPEAVPSGCVSFLEDIDGDEVFDKRTVFLDGLSWPTAIAPHDGGVLVLVAPELIHAKDTNGDGVADVKRTLFRGFGTGNVQALANGLARGLDGWIYGAGGGNGGDIELVAKPGADRVSIRGRDFRFRPDGSAFEAIEGGGQFGNTFDDFGHRFTCSNSNHIRQFVIPARYLDRNPALAGAVSVADVAREGPAAAVFRISPPEHWRVVRTRRRLLDPSFVNRLSESEKHAIGFFTSATGVTIYRGSALPPELQGNAFIGDVGGNLVHRKRIEVKGPRLEAVRADVGVEFLASTDTWFRPVQFANTPGGGLLILDMYRETIEHPASIPEDIKAHLDLTSGHDRGRLYHLVPVAHEGRLGPSLSKATTAALVSHLASPDGWWRDTAQRLLAERRDPSAVPMLKALAADRPSPLARLHALWALHEAGALEANDLTPAFDDPEPGVRENAARLAEGALGLNARVHASLLKLASDDSGPVRLQAALSLGGLEGGDALAALAAIARHDADDPWVRSAVLSGLSGRVPAFLAALKAVDPAFLASGPGRSWLDDLAALAGAEDRPAVIADLIAGFAGPVAPPDQARAVVLGLGRGLARAGRSLRDRLDERSRTALVGTFEEAVAEIDAPETAEARRVESIRLVALGPLEAAIESLPNQLSPRFPKSAQLAALQGLASIRDPRVGPAVASRWPELGPGLRAEAIATLLALPDRVRSLLDAIESGVLPGSELDRPARDRLLAIADRALRERAAKVLSSLPSRPGRAAMVASYQGALALPGDRERGREVYRRACATCHRAEGLGVAVGPDLATVAGRSPDDLLIHVLDPNREVAPAYVTYTVATTDGLVLSGLLAAESASDITLRRAEGATDVVPRSRIEAIKASGVSLMPENLETQAGPAAVADLIAFLRGLRAD
jgi:putative membrane-bound dehydrogenase-like protein